MVICPPECEKTFRVIYLSRKILISELTRSSFGPMTTKAPEYINSAKMSSEECNAPEQLKGANLKTQMKTISEHVSMCVCVLADFNEKTADELGGHFKYMKGLINLIMNANGKRLVEFLEKMSNSVKNVLEMLRRDVENRDSSVKGELTVIAQILDKI